MIVHSCINLSVISRSLLVNHKINIYRNNEISHKWWISFNIEPFVFWTKGIALDHKKAAISPMKRHIVSDNSFLMPWAVHDYSLVFNYLGWWKSHLRLLLSTGNQSFLMHFCVGPIDSLKVTGRRTFRCRCHHFDSIPVIVALSLMYTLFRFMLWRKI